MRIKIAKEVILPAMLRISGIIERRQTLPILGSVLFNVSNRRLYITATDLEVEIKTHVQIESDDEGMFTIQARKFLDICKFLPDKSDIDIVVSGDKTKILSGKSKFVLGSLTAKEFPILDISKPDVSLEIQEEKLKDLLNKTSFSMAHQDVRYYLNGLLIEIEANIVKGVATDGHRLALCRKTIDNESNCSFSVLLPRKAVAELDRMLERTQNSVYVQIFSNIARFIINESILTTKLIDGQFPDYSRVIPNLCDRKAVIDKEIFKGALIRASILSTDKYKGIRISLDKGSLTIQAHNPEQEEAEEVLDIEYEDDSMTIGYNVGYLLDILATMDTENIELEFSASNNSSMIKPQGYDECLYVVMPMRL